MNNIQFSIRDLAVSFDTNAGSVEVVSGVSFELRSHEVHGVVGESGCGKTITFLAAMGLLPSNGSVTRGQAIFGGVDLISASDSSLDRIRGRDITYIPQDPQSALNPIMTIGRQIAEPLMLHQGLKRREARARAVALLQRVGIPEPRQRMDEYPHQLSGGMCQRVLIAMAVSCTPKLLVADEPTTGLDATVQLQILDLLNELKEENGMSIVFITHDLGIIAEVADRITVMYSGRVVERGGVFDVFERAQHPYTSGLLGSLPVLNSTVARLRTIKGTVPAPGTTPPGCPFVPRCNRALPECSIIAPVLERTETTDIACYNPISQAVTIQPMEAR